MRKERAKQNRILQMMKAADLADAQAAQVPTLYPEWRAGEGVPRRPALLHAYRQAL